MVKPLVALRHLPWADPHTTGRSVLQGTLCAAGGVQTLRQHSPRGGAHGRGLKSSKPFLNVFKIQECIKNAQDTVIYLIFRPFLNHLFLFQGAQMENQENAHSPPKFIISHRSSLGATPWVAPNRMVLQAPVGPLRYPEAAASRGYQERRGHAGSRGVTIMIVILSIIMINQHLFNPFHYYCLPFCQFLSFSTVLSPLSIASAACFFNAEAAGRFWCRMPRPQTLWHSLGVDSHHLAGRNIIAAVVNCPQL